MNRRGFFATLGALAFVKPALQLTPVTPTPVRVNRVWNMFRHRVMNNHELLNGQELKLTLNASGMFTFTGDPVEWRESGQV